MFIASRKFHDGWCDMFFFLLILLSRARLPQISNSGGRTTHSFLRALGISPIRWSTPRSFASDPVSSGPSSPFGVALSGHEWNLRGAFGPSDQTDLARHDNVEFLFFSSLFRVYVAVSPSPDSVDNQWHLLVASNTCLDCLPPPPSLLPSSSFFSLCSLKESSFPLLSFCVLVSSFGSIHRWNACLLSLR